MKRHVRQRGIALIIVLGLMSVLIIMAVAFTVSMRTERLAARSFADETRSKEMVRVALARAMLKVQTDLTASKLAAPNWLEGCLYSTGGSNLCPDLLSGMASNHVPRALWPAVAASSGSWRWIAVTDPTDVNRTCGQCAWLAIDCTGLLDGNRGLDFAPWFLPRGEGTNYTELCLTNAFLTELADGLKPLNLMAGRKGTARAPPWGRAETLPDLLACGLYGYGSLNPFVGNKILNFCSYSCFPTGYCDAALNAVRSIYVGNLGVIQAQKADIAAAFAAMPNGPVGADATMAADNMADYLDIDLVPSDDGKGFCTEPVPMIDEICVNSKLTTAAGKFSVTVELEVKLWYPFVGPALADSVVVAAPVSLAGTGWSALADPAAPYTVAGPWQRGASEYQVAKFSFKATATSNLPPTSLTIGEITVSDGGKVVDRVAPTGGSGLLIWGDYFSTANNVQMYNDWQVDDPRINYEWNLKNAAAFTPTDPSAQAWHLVGTAKSMTHPATLTPPLSALTSQNAGTRKPSERTEMYVRNRDVLPTVGELGYLLYRKDRPWQTISLLGSNALPVLDRFTVLTNAAHGVVSINSFNTNVLASAFFGLPMERYPGQPGAPTLGLVDARKVAALIVAKMPANGYANLSDLKLIDIGTPLVPATLSSQFVDTSVPGNDAPGMDAMTRESFIRTTASLLGVRQNLFTLILAGQALSDNGAEVVGEQRAVALVWRDPYKDASGKNRMFVRFLKWLED